MQIEDLEGETLEGAVTFVLFEALRPGPFFSLLTVYQ